MNKKLRTIGTILKSICISVVTMCLCVFFISIFAGFALNRILLELDTYKFQNKIKNKQVSFVVQGPIFGGKDSTYKGSTQACLKSIRRHFPESSIILSSWKGSNVHGLDYDKLVLSEEPKGFIHTNIKQHISTLAGLKMVTSEYALKIRSDAYLAHGGFIKYYAKYGIKSGGMFNVFDGNKIILSANWQPTQSPPLLHLCDFYYFGRTKDLVSIFAQTPFITKSQDTYFKEYCRANVTDCYMAQFAPEQWYFLSSFHKAFPKDKIENYRFYDQNVFLNTNKFIADNIILLGDLRSGIYLPKYFHHHPALPYKEYVTFVNRFGTSDTPLSKVRSSYYERLISYTYATMPKAFWKSCFVSNEKSPWSLEYVRTLLHCERTNIRLLKDKNFASLALLLANFLKHIDYWFI